MVDSIILWLWRLRLQLTIFSVAKKFVFIYRCWPTHETKLSLKLEKRSFLRHNNFVWNLVNFWRLQWYFDPYIHEPIVYCVIGAIVTQQFHSFQKEGIYHQMLSSQKNCIIFEKIIYCPRKNPRCGLVIVVANLF